jgi:hypothetical protein
MQPLNQEGRFKARPQSWSVLLRDDGRPYLMMRFAIVAGPGEGEQPWDDWTQYQYEIVGFFNLLKLDGNENTVVIEKLEKSLGWDRSSLENLQNGHWQNVTVQIETKFEERNGNRSLTVKWIHPFDYEGKKKLTPEQLQKANAQWGKRLRKRVSMSPATPTPLGTDSETSTDGVQF